MSRFLMVLLVLLVPSLVKATEVGRYRVYNSDRTIFRIVGGIGAGLLLGEGGHDAVELIKEPQIEINGEPGKIWHALLWMTGFVLDLDLDGEVKYNYTLAYRGIPVHRQTTIKDGYVRAKTTISAPMNLVDWAVLITEAREHSSGTQIVNTLWISTRYGNRCRLVRRIVHRRAGPELCGALRKIESGAKQYFDTGTSHPMVRTFVDEYLSRSKRL